MEERKKAGLNCLVPFLFAVYLILLVWIILFKLQLSVHELDRIRSINLIPFYYDNEIGMGFHLKEVLENVAIFIPYGIYLCMLKKEPGFKVKFFLILMTSFILEVLQYILAVGGTDITDIITNTCGGVAGIGIYWSATRIFRGKKRAETVIVVLAAIVTIVVAGGLSVLLIAN
ncbi:VanZ family protein [Lachnospiraceae bacterium 54-11]